MRERTRNALTVTLSIGTLIVLAALLAALSGEPGQSDRGLNRPSTMFTDESGARAALLVAQRLLPSAEQWRMPPTALPPPDGPDQAPTLVVSGPLLPLTPSQADALDRWVGRGGQLVLLLDDDWRIERGDDPVSSAGYLERHEIHVHGGEWARKAYRPVLVEAVGPEPLTLCLPSGCKLTGEGAPLGRRGEDVVVAGAAVGQGRIVVIPDASFISNDSLPRSDNAALLVGLCAGWGSGRALFDEFHQGFGQKRGTAALAWAFARTPWGWTALTIAAAGLIYVFGHRRRFGRPVEPPAPDRASPLDLVDARAGLFRTAGSAALAVNVICLNLAHELGRALGRPVDLAELYRHHQQSSRPPACLEQIGRLARLWLRVRTEGRAERRDVHEAGNLAAQILEEMAVD